MSTQKYPPRIAQIESLDFEGHGVAHVEAQDHLCRWRTALETVEYSTYRKKANFENAQAMAILKESFVRTTPRCPHFGVCGGCSMQHMNSPHR